MAGKNAAAASEASDETETETELEAARRVVAEEMSALKKRVAALEKAIFGAHAPE